MHRRPHLSLDQASIVRFRRTILRFYRLHGRSLPWRTTTDSYAVAVSEIMLQQTQVSWVVPKYLAWLRRWPDWQSLATAKRAEVLQQWSGLGYNRRALSLHNLAEHVVDRCDGFFPDTPDQLRQLPGIGPYLSRSILIFSRNAPLAAVDTNIRRVLIHAFALPQLIPAQKLQEIAERVLPRGRSREWHNALMDYGTLSATARATGVTPIGRQSVFAGSRRALRGAIIRALSNVTARSVRVLARLPEADGHDLHAVIADLIRDGMVERSGSRVRLSE